jgi:hypothetical protein
MEHEPDFAAMCERKQKHATRKEARIEATQKANITGRRHDTYGCPLGNHFHAKAALSPQKKKKLTKRRNRRPSYAVEA